MTVRYEPAVRRYLALGLRMGRLIDGYVDCWFGDRELARQIEAEAPADPAELAAEASRLRASLGDSGLDEQRQRFLAAQLNAVACAARRLAGEPVAFRHEVETYFEVDIELGDPERYAQVHDQIHELLPGPGPLREKVEAFYERNVVPPDRLLGAVQAVSDQLRVRVDQLFGLPSGERVGYELTENKPWHAFNRYHGGLRSTVTLDANAGRTIGVLPLMVTHESYPGHHTEHCVKETVLVAGRGQGEHQIALVNTPQCLLAEGTAEHGVAAALGPGWGRWTADLLADRGIRIEGELVERLLPLVVALMPARQDAAILLHDRGADAGDVVEYLRRWMLLPRDRAEGIVKFLTDPLWRAYSVTYVEGARLVGAWLDARPAGQSLAERYRTLLREQLLPSALRDDLRAVTRE
jgi:hypothetical protein